MGEQEWEVRRYLSLQTEDGALVYAGRLERDLSEKDKREMLKRLALHVRKQPMNAAPKRFPRLEGKSSFW